ncbi:MAG: ABC transporter ATP-binding protein [Oscillospiraceae bacterium]|nr:ABC transporter ATP-binding protein [Oscillospiraceae bacterium]
MISVQDVFMKYPAAKEDTIRGISFDVKQGEIFGFLGPSGAGKSTLQKILTGVLRQYRGSVRVLDIEAKNRTSNFYENIGVDFEFPNFYGKFTGLENLKYFASLYSAKTIDLLTLIKKVGLHNDVDKKVGSFSKGMKMRLGFVRCLMHNPQLLFLDEPTSGLDPANARILKDMILEQKMMGKTIILTTHNMHDAEELCDRVAFIVDGKIEALNAPRILSKSCSETRVAYSFIAEDGREIQKDCLISELGMSESFQASLKEGTLTSIHSKEQTLEDVFIALTGRHLQ